MDGGAWPNVELGVLKRRVFGTWQIIFHLSSPSLTKIFVQKCGRRLHRLSMGMTFFVDFKNPPPFKLHFNSLSRLLYHISYSPWPEITYLHKTMNFKSGHIIDVLLIIVQSTQVKTLPFHFSQGIWNHKFITLIQHTYYNQNRIFSAML